MAANVEGLRARLVEHYRRVHADAVDGVVADLVAAAPVGKTGDLARGIAADPQQTTPTGFVSTVRADAPQAEWTNYGTVPHVIRPRSPGGTLRFEIGGETVFARYVWHPGYIGSRWWTNTLQQTWPENLARSAAAA